jgi:Ser/Thr protein kinase RdoA (MazF antagonist)
VSYARSRSAEPSVAALQRDTDWPGRVESLIAAILHGVEDVPVRREDWSFSTGDLAPHNVLVTPDEDICVLDLEYSGWDDPVMPATDFLSAETSTDLSPEHARVFLSAYADLAQLSPQQLARLHRVRALMEVGWVAVHLSLQVPERIAPKRFADPTFDVMSHLTKHATLANARLARAERLIPELLSD